MNCFKLGLWLILLSIRWPVSYKNDGEWYNSTEAMDLFSFIDEMTLAQDVELSLRYRWHKKVSRGTTKWPLEKNVLDELAKVFIDKFEESRKTHG